MDSIASGLSQRVASNSTATECEHTSLPGRQVRVDAGVALGSRRLPHRHAILDFSLGSKRSLRGSLSIQPGGAAYGLGVPHLVVGVSSKIAYHSIVTGCLACHYQATGIYYTISACPEPWLVATVSVTWSTGCF